MVVPRYLLTHNFPFLSFLSNHHPQRSYSINSTFALHFIFSLASSTWAFCLPSDPSINLVVCAILSVVLSYPISSIKKPRKIWLFMSLGTLDCYPGMSLVSDDLQLIRNGSFQKFYIDYPLSSCEVLPQDPFPKQEKIVHDTKYMKATKLHVSYSTRNWPSGYLPMLTLCICSRLLLWLYLDRCSKLGHSVHCITSSRKSLWYARDN